MKILILVNNSVKVSSDNSLISEIEKVYRHNDIHYQSKIHTFKTVKSSDSPSCFQINLFLSTVGTSIAAAVYGVGLTGE